MRIVRRCSLKSCPKNLEIPAIAYPVGVAEDVFVKVGKFHFPADFVVVDYDVDPQIPLILGRPFLRTARALIDVHGEELILRDGCEKLIFHVDNTSKHPHKHNNESINMINFIDITCEDRFPEVLKLKKSNHPSSGSTTLHSDYSLPDYDAFYFDDDHIKEKSSGSTTTHSDFSLPEYDSFIFDLSIDPFPPADKSAFYHEEFADELALLDPFLPRNEVDNFDPEADLRKIKYLLKQDPSTESSPKSDIEIIDPILERFTDEPALGDSYKDIDRENSLLAVDEPFLLDTPPPGSKLVNLKEVENFDPSLSLIRSEMMTRMADIPSLKLNEDECFDLGGGEIDADIPSEIEDDYYNSEGDIIYLESLLNNDTIPYLPPEVFLDHDPRRLKDEPNIDDLKIKENVRFTFEDLHYLSLAFVIKIFLPFLTYLVNSLLLLSSGSEDTIFDPDIFAYSFYSLEPVEYENPIMIFSFFFFCPKDKGIRGEIAPDYEDSRARGFVHRSLKLQYFACIGYSEKDKNNGKTDETEYGNEMSARNQSRRRNNL
ncbi:reverse transcriptase domain-containing protein [Tanacetum coccineum]